MSILIASLSPCAPGFDVIVQVVAVTRTDRQPNEHIEKGRSGGAARVARTLASKLHSLLYKGLRAQHELSVGLNDSGSYS